MRSPIHSQLGAFISIAAFIFRGDPQILIYGPTSRHKTFWVVAVPQLANLRCRYLSSRASLSRTPTARFMKKPHICMLSLKTCIKHALLPSVSLCIYIPQLYHTSLMIINQEYSTFIHHHSEIQNKMHSNLEKQTRTTQEKVSESSIDLTLQHSEIQLGQILGANATYEEDRKILRKIDRL